MRLAALASAAAIATSPAASGVGFLQTRQLDSGGFAEAGQSAFPQLTAWAVLGLHAAGANLSSATARYLVQHEPELRSATDLALVVLAEDALGQSPDRPLARLRALERPNGSVGGLVNGTTWSVIAFRAAGTPIHRNVTQTYAVSTHLAQNVLSYGMHGVSVRSVQSPVWGLVFACIWCPSHSDRTNVISFGAFGINKRIVIGYDLATGLETHFR